mmetsp:Transcript_27967/g.63275  ORF Transcript_27967/g.63275 Transcript_27967/m.63275 type:complete len:204 (-) Transcript_27967:780-1391(-)
MPIRAAQGRPNQDPNQAQLCGHAYSPALNASPRLCLTSQLELARVVMVSAPRPPGGGLDSLEALHAELVQLELDASELGEDALPVERLNERLPPGVADLVAEEVDREKLLEGAADGECLCERSAALVSNQVARQPEPRELAEATVCVCVFHGLGEQDHLVVAPPHRLEADEAAVGEGADEALTVALDDEVHVAAHTEHERAAG